MKWIYFPTLPPYEKEVLFDGDDNENPPSWGRLRKVGKFDEIVVMESSGEENLEPLSDYKRWLDESESPTAVDVPGEEGLKERAKGWAKVNANTGGFGEVKLAESAYIAGALSVRQQGDEGRYRAALEKLVQRVQNYFDERKENPRNKNSGLSKMLNYVAFAMSEAREVLSQSPASLQSGIVQKLRDANPYGKLNPNSTNKDTWIKCCDTLAKLIEGEKGKEGKQSFEGLDDNK